MSSVGYLNIVKNERGFRCFFVDKEDAACAICLTNGEPVKVFTEEEVIESKIEKREGFWIIKNYEYLDIQGLKVEIQI